MAVSVQVPGWKPQKQEKPKKDALDQIQQGLMIAQAAYGIYADSEKLDLAKKAQGAARENDQLQKAGMQADTDYKKAQTAALQNKPDPEDALSQKDMADLLGKGWQVSPDGNAQQFALKGGKSVGLIPPKPQPTGPATKLPDDDGLSQKELADLYGKGWKPGEGTGAVQMALKGGKSTSLIPPSDGVGTTSKMSETERAATDKAAAGLEAVADMRNAVNAVAGRSGIKQASERVKIMSDTPFTEARTRYTEAIGRLQSGGAINKEEADRFVGMAPGPLDSYAMAQIKLKNAYTDLASRLKSRGMDPEKVLAERKALRDQSPGLTPQRDSGTATAAPSLKPVGQMTNEELLRELGQ